MMQFVRTGLPRSQSLDFPNEFLNRRALAKKFHSVGIGKSRNRVQSFDLQFMPEYFFFVAPFTNVPWRLPISSRNSVPVLRSDCFAPAAGSRGYRAASVRCSPGGQFWNGDAPTITSLRVPFGSITLRRGPVAINLVRAPNRRTSGKRVPRFRARDGQRSW